MKNILIVEDRAFFKKAARIFLESAAEAIRERGRFTVVLSGGSTPKKLFELLADPLYRERVDWANVYFFWGDERCVPPNDSQSNYGMAKKYLLDKVPCSENNVFRMAGEVSPPAQAARAYQKALSAFFKQEKSVPLFDLILLGVGEDGHTASLFPKTQALTDRLHWVAAHYVEKLSSYRMTMTLTLLNNARKIVFLAAGYSKSAIIKEIHREDMSRDRYPAQLVFPAKGELIWLLDKSAASQLPSDGRAQTEHPNV